MVFSWMAINIVGSIFYVDQTNATTSAKSSESLVTVAYNIYLTYGFN